MKVAIIGAGAMPTVSAMILTENAHAVRMWGFLPEEIEQLRATRENRRYLPGVRLPEAVELTSDPAAAFEGAEIILSAVPTQFVRRSWQRLKPFCPPGMPVVSAAKGIENDTLLRPTQVLLDVLEGDPDAADRRPVAALSGPSIAHELAHRLPATVAVAASDEALARCVRDLFATPSFRVYTNPDLVGVELGGAVKNVIAIAAGVLEGLGAGDNAKASLVTRGLVEIARLGVAAGARRETFAGLAGLGDLVTTCFSPHGRNRTFGHAVGAGRTPEEVLASMTSVVEGVATTRSVLALAKRLGVEMPITRAVHAVIFEGKNPREAILELMTRSLKAEDAEWA